MIRLLWRLVRSLLTLLVLGAALYLGGPYLLAHAGHYLIAEDPPAQSDVVVVVSRQPYLSVPEAARLYHERLASKLLLINAPRPAGQDELLRVGIRYPDALEISLQLLDALRVPRAAVLTIPERTDDLRTEAQLVSRFLTGRPARTLILVTAKAHSVRARKIFAEVLGAQVALIVRPAPADPFDPDRWWKNRDDFRQAVWEYTALANLWGRRLWRAVVEEATSAPPAVPGRLTANTERLEMVCLP